MEKYEIIKLLGSGSYGECYLVREKATREQFVMKQMSLSSEKMQASAFTEAKLLRTLKHPNIVEYHDHFEVMNGKPARRFLCAVMTFCEQGDLLQKMLAQKGVPFAEKQILEYFVQLLLALEYIHSKRVLHRDIKAQNIFLSRGVVKLGDFGISKILEGSVDLASTVIGTPYYMSPELLRNKPYGYKSDVWAAGCVLYEMLCLKHAFDGKDYLGLVNNILKGQVPPVPTHYSQHIRDILRAMLQKEPEKRPSVRQVLSHPIIKAYMSEVVQQTGAVARAISAGQPQAVTLKKLGPLPSKQTPLAAIIDKEKPVAISPARLRLLKQLEASRRVKEDIAAKLNEVRNKKPVNQSTPEETTVRKTRLGLEVPVLDEKRRSKSPASTGERRLSVGASKEQMFPLVSNAAAEKQKTQQISDERKQLLEKRWQAMLEKDKQQTDEIKRPEPMPEKLHVTLEHHRAASADIIGSDETKLKEELDKVEKDQAQLEMTLETLISEEKEEEGEQERSMVMQSYAEHAQAATSSSSSPEAEEESPEPGEITTTNTSHGQEGGASTSPRHHSPGELRNVHHSTSQHESMVQEQPPPSVPIVAFPEEEDLPNTLVDRVKYLKQFCVEHMGEEAFQKSYMYTCNNDVIDEDDPGLLSVLGPKLGPYSKALLSLVMTEKDLPSQSPTPPVTRRATPPQLSKPH